ncbi:MAG: sigma-70 family RNA polymerase sigma factor [Isosphaerales bacterium]
MAHAAAGSIVPQIEALFDGCSVSGLTDGQLLERFTARRDAAGEAAFAALVARHGPMVLGVCHRFLGDRHHAEDAFQAVFFVLARKARSIRDPNLVGTWLYGVAVRTARKAKVRLARQRRHEEGDAMRRPGLGSSVRAVPMAPPADEPVLAREQAEALHDEIDRLPQSFRLPVVLCYFEGLSLDEAAGRLRWPAGTVGSRLARARDKLRRGLTRRGVVLPAAAMAAALNSKSASARVSTLLCDTTTRAAIRFAAGQTAGEAASALAQEVLRSMLLHKLKVTVLALLALAAVATGAGFLTHSLAMMKDEPKRSPIGQQPATLAAKPEGVSQAPAAGRMFVTGRVLDPQGKPVPNAAVMVYARLKLFERPIGFVSQGPLAISQTRCDGSGRFRIDAPRTSSSRQDLLGITALASGYGIGWGELDPDAEQPTIDVALRPEQVIQGRLFDVQGQPARGVKVSIANVLRSSHGETEGPNLFPHPPKDLPAWPEPATSDADGRFTLRGLGRELLVALTVDDPRFASHFTRIETTGGTVFESRPGIRVPAVKLDAGADPKKLTIALPPAQIITGRVTYADSGKPVPHAPLSVSASAKGSGGSRSTHFEADGEGRFRVNPSPGDRFSLTTQSPDGQPYLSVSKRIDWPKGAVEQSVDLSLPRGVVIGGKVTEEGSGKPVAGAVVRFTPYEHASSNPSSSSVPSATGSDGSFRLAAPPGPGYVVTQGPSDDYVLREMGVHGGVYVAKPGSRRFYAHAYTFLDLKPDSAGQEINVVLRRGMTVKVRVVGPDDRPVQDATVISRVILMTPPTGGWRFWSFRNLGRVRDGRFELHGLDPDTEVPVFFLDSRHELGATAHLTGKSAAGGPVTVRLERCGTVKARLVGPGGKPVERYRLPSTAMIVTPGAIFKPTDERAGRLFADEVSLSGLDPTRYKTHPSSDAQGRVVLSALIPGATYRFADTTTYRDPGGPFIRKEFTIKPGETLDLGDILIAKPPG